MKKYLYRVAAALVLAGGFMTSAHAVPVTINMTADNIASVGGLCADASCRSGTGWNALNGGPLGNSRRDWRQSDSLTVDLDAGTYYFAWRVRNIGRASRSNPAGLLAEILWDGGANYSSSDWEVFNRNTGVFLANATDYGLNGGANIWTNANGGNPVAGISTNASWIYTANNFANADRAAWFRTSITIAPTSVPEPGALGLFGIGLIGLAMVRRKRTA
ncbi:MAG TPA: PEP-CTERM sorting domain-containing protein [Gammaproteobacteria bacterium]|nr:PEP-CTERM sorting domain-containing protein [Gammaproteobacteria bacterium]